MTAAGRPAAGAAVMGTGIVSIALALDHEELLSHILLALASALWLTLGWALVARARADCAEVRHDARSPAALTGVAATAVLGTSFALPGWDVLAVALLVIATALAVALLAPVLRSWKTPTTGVSLMLTVSVESLAVLAAALAVRDRAAWLAIAGLVPFCLGVAFYLFVIARFELRHLATGCGDHWVTGGALAISALAAGKLTQAARMLGSIAGLHSPLQTVSVVLWALSVSWLPVLLIAEALRPRPGYDVRRWATVFPVGMYAACSFVVGAEAHAPALIDFARVWVWIAFAVWLVVSGAAVYSLPASSAISDRKS